MRLSLGSGVVAGLALLAVAAGPGRPQSPAAVPPSTVATEPTFEAYVEAIPDTKVKFEMVAIPAGTFLMGSPQGEAGRADDEGPQVQVAVPAFWMGRFEVTWNEYDLFAVARRRDSTPMPAGADAVTQPTPPYADESFGYSKGRQPALSITHHAAMEYCRWLRARTGKTYRLPTEAEWEYACRAGATTRYSFGDGEADLAANAWSQANADDHPHSVGQKKPNAWGLFDMHGNLAEWVLDTYDSKTYATWAQTGGLVAAPVVVPDERRYPHVVRGGSWDDPPAKLRSAARRSSERSWNRRDPQRPQSIWWLTDATHVGFRLVRPVEEQKELLGLKSKVTRQSPF